MGNANDPPERVAALARLNGKLVPLSGLANNPLDGLLNVLGRDAICGTGVTPDLDAEKFGEAREREFDPGFSIAVGDNYRFHLRFPLSVVDMNGWSLSYG